MATPLYYIMTILLLTCISCASTHQSQSSSGEVQYIVSDTDVAEAPINPTKEITENDLTGQLDSLFLQVKNGQQRLDLDKQNFENEKNLSADLLNLRESFLAQREKELDSREAQLEKREQSLLLEKSALDQLQSLKSSPPLNQERSSTPTTPTPIKDLLPLRYIQFVATTGGKTFSALTHLGNIITEKVPGKNLYRYQLMSRYSDEEMALTIAELKKLGYSGAFELK